MRIIAGAAGGRRLVAPKGDEVRPTADRVKEALFSSLQPQLPGAHVLDLFAGSGALGLEALSRGAAAVTLVERGRAAIAAIETNIATVDLPGVELVRADVRSAVGGLLPGAPFDLVLIDPPYALDDAGLATLLQALVGHLAAEATVVVERGSRSAAPEWPPDLLPTEPRRYGDTTLHRADRRDERSGATSAPEPSGEREQG